MKNKQVSKILPVMLLLSAIFLCCPTLKAKASSGIDNITARSDYMYYTMWTPQKNVNGWWDGATYHFANGTKWGGTFYQGNYYHIPYGQPITAGEYIGYGATVGEFLDAANNADSIFYNVASYNQYNMPSKSTYYANDCSSFVSYCWGLPSRKTTYDWSGLNVTSLGSCNITNIQRIQQGDAICRSAHHIVLISRVNANGTYEVTEQTPPEMKRSIYSAAQLASEYGNYTIYRYNGRNGVLPPDISTPVPAPTRAELDFTVNSTRYALGENVGLHVDSDNAARYTLYVCEGDTVVYTCELPSMLYTVVPPKAGSYTAYVIARNNGGELKSNVLSFTVYDSVPSKVKVSMAKDTYEIDETITFAFSSESSLYYTFKLYNADTNKQLIEKTTENNLYAVKFSAAGEYYGILTAYNEIGWTQCEPVTFKVTEHLVVEGDITGDGVLDTNDIKSLQDYLHRRTTFTEEEFKTADLTKDGAVNVIDLAMMKRHLANH